LQVAANLSSPTRLLSRSPRCAATWLKPYSTSSTPYCVMSAGFATVGRFGLATIPSFGVFGHWAALYAGNTHNRNKTNAPRPKYLFGVSVSTLRPALFLWPFARPKSAKVASQCLYSAYWTLFHFLCEVGGKICRNTTGGARDKNPYTFVDGV